MWVRRVEGRDCPRCGATVGVGLKEEPTGWKVYRVCTGEDSSCDPARIGMIDRTNVTHLDDIGEYAEKLL